MSGVGQWPWVAADEWDTVRDADSEALCMDSLEREASDQNRKGPPNRADLRQIIANIQQMWFLVYNRLTP